GIILLALGAALILRSGHHPALAGLGIAAALFHSLNHAVFKALLFMGAGTIQSATHSRDLERLGGLMRNMPWTGACFTIAAAAALALPPFNGFASEWLIFQSLITVGLHVSAAGIGISAILAGVMLGLSGALAAVCFVKAVGITFLGQPRSAAAASAVEVGGLERFGAVLLACCCVLLGLVPPLVLRLLEPVSRSLVGVSPLGVSSSWLSGVDVPGTAGHTALQPVGLLLGLLGAGILSLVLMGAFRRRTKARVSKTWNCGVTLTPRMQYSSTSFAQPIRRMFSAIIWPERSLKVETSHSPYFVSAISYEVSLKPLFERFVYGPVHALFLRVIQLVRLLQNGSIHAYLAYVFIALVVVLAVAR
ncbi:MAG: formate hydrogenlyase subunit 3/multisubunit Na+/H+ antiporter, MnhD subunit, partial [Chloroflexi bacterium]|nr:formate hydrogenlyase subunit 3/multisubunit Na+/H+ antiporter, MnhD subunit [Chloroflexota bacterium]